MTLTDTDRRVLVYLSRNDTARCSEVGWYCFAPADGGNRGSSNPWTRPAGAALARLRKRGLVERTAVEQRGAFAILFAITRQGRKALA